MSMDSWEAAKHAGLLMRTADVVQTSAKMYRDPRTPQTPEIRDSSSLTQWSMSESLGTACVSTSRPASATPTAAATSVNAVQHGSTCTYSTGRGATVSDSYVRDSSAGCFNERADNARRLYRDTGTDSPARSSGGSTLQTEGVPTSYGVSQDHRTGQDERRSMATYMYSDVTHRDETLSRTAEYIPTPDHSPSRPANYDSESPGYSEAHPHMVSSTAQMVSCRVSATAMCPDDLAT